MKRFIAGADRSQSRGGTTKNAQDSLLHPTLPWTNAAGIVTVHHAVFDEKLDDDIRDRLRMRHSCHDMGAEAVCGHQSAKGTHPQRSS